MHRPWSVAPPEIRDRFEQSRTKHVNGSARIEPSKSWTLPASEIEATHAYRDPATGAVLFEIVRTTKAARDRGAPKTLPRHLVDGRWFFGAGLWAGRSDELPLYREAEVVEELRQGGVAHLVEGERDADRIHEAAGVAACNAWGAGKFRESHARTLAAALRDGEPHAELVVIADRDDEGARHVAVVREKLAAAGAPLERVRTVQPRTGKDAADHFAAGHGIDEFEPFALTDALSLEPRAAATVVPIQTGDVATVEADGAGALPGRFFAEDGLVVPRLGDAIERLGNVRGGIDGRLYRYSNGVYAGDGDAFVRVSARRLLGDRFKRRHVDEVIAYLRASYHEVSDAQPEGVLNVANGLLEWRSGPALIPHTPDVVSTIQIPVAWAPGARCPRIFAFIEDTLGDAAGLMIEMIGYALLPANPMRVAVLLLGPGRNGKSVLLHVIKALLGSGNTSSVPLQVLAEHRFAAAELFGKLANICGDLDARAVRQTDVFKMLTGGDPMMGERKHRDPFTFTPFALPLFSANEPPLSSDQTEAWFDRWIVVPMERRIPENEIDPHLLSKLTARDELEGLLILAVEGLRRLMARGRFELPDSVRAARLAYRERLDSVAGFIAEQCELSPQAWTGRPVLYGAYRQWASDSGRLPVSAATFNDHLRRGYEGKAEERTRNGVRGWAGIWLREGSHDA